MVNEQTFLEWFQAHPDTKLADWQAANPQLAQVNVWPVITKLVRSNQLIRNQHFDLGVQPYTTYRVA